VNSHALVTTYAVMHHRGDVAPHQPMRVQVLSSVLSIERPRRRVLWIHINADAPCLAAVEPSRQGAQQCSSHARSSPFRDDIEPLEFAVAAEETSEVSGEEPEDELVVRHDQNQTR